MNNIFFIAFYLFSAIWDMEDYCSKTTAKQTELIRAKDDGRLTVKRRKLSDGAMLHLLHAPYVK